MDREPGILREGGIYRSFVRLDLAVGGMGPGNFELKFATSQGGLESIKIGVSTLMAEAMSIWT